MCRPNIKLEGESITVDDLERCVKDNDIVLLHARNFDKHDRPYISLNSAEWMAKHIRPLGIVETIPLEDSPKPLLLHKIFSKTVLQ